MIEAVFISDLHLNPNDTAITRRFESFIQWAASQVKTVYILGDFFHVWPGDDALDDWSCSIASHLSWLSSQGINIYFMRGNRDFLIGEAFAKLASITFLKEPTVITLGVTKVLLMHGDSYCTKDKPHQWFRRLTRNFIFPKLFLKIPYAVRTKIVTALRQHSQSNDRKLPLDMDIVVPVMLRHMVKMRVTVLIHGHIHKPGLTEHDYLGGTYQQYVLSDWDDKPFLMCYDNASGFFFKRLPGG